MVNIIPVTATTAQKKADLERSKKKTFPETIKRKVVFKPGKQALKLENDVGNHQWLHQLRRISKSKVPIKWMDFFNTPSLVNVGATFHIDTSQ